jgi:Ca2+-binding RTX toxin-like protein
MRRAILSLTTMGAAILLAGGLALAADVSCSGEYCEGTTGNDTMTGSASEDQMYGIGGNDTMYGKDGADSMWGDWHQVIDPGEPGNDTMYGGNGPDRLQGDERTDTLNGGRGNDRIEAKDGERDIINCGRGMEDVAFFDRGIDSVSNCEIKNPPVG